MVGNGTDNKRERVPLMSFELELLYRLVHEKMRDKKVPDQEAEKWAGILVKVSRARTRVFSAN